jgi:hypothetical protein
MYQILLEIRVLHSIIEWDSFFGSQFVLQSYLQCIRFWIRCAFCNVSELVFDLIVVLVFNHNSYLIWLFFLQPIRIRIRWLRFASSFRKPWSSVRCRGKCLRRMTESSGRSGSSAPWPSCAWRRTICCRIRWSEQRWRSRRKIPAMTCRIIINRLKLV